MRHATARTRSTPPRCSVALFASLPAPNRPKVRGHRGRRGRRSSPTSPSIGFVLRTALRRPTTASPVAEGTFPHLVLLAGIGATHVGEDAPGPQPDGPAVWIQSPLGLYEEADTEARAPPGQIPQAFPTRVIQAAGRLVLAGSDREVRYLAPGARGRSGGFCRPADEIRGWDDETLSSRVGIRRPPDKTRRRSAPCDRVRRERGEPWVAASRQSSREAGLHDRRGDLAEQRGTGRAGRPAPRAGRPGRPPSPLVAVASRERVATATVGVSTPALRAMRQRRRQRRAVAPFAPRARTSAYLEVGEAACVGEAAGRSADALQRVPEVLADRDRADVDELIGSWRQCSTALATTPDAGVRGQAQPPATTQAGANGRVVNDASTAGCRMAAPRRCRAGRVPIFATVPCFHSPCSSTWPTRRPGRPGVGRLCRSGHHRRAGPSSRSARRATHQAAVPPPARSRPRGRWCQIHGHCRPPRKAPPPATCRCTVRPTSPVWKEPGAKCWCRPAPASDAMVPGAGRDGDHRQHQWYAEAAGPRGRGRRAVVRRAPVTNAEFARFVAGPGTSPSPRPRPTRRTSRCRSGPCCARLPGVHADPRSVSLADWTQWWRWQPGASWRTPQGPREQLGGRRRPPRRAIAYWGTRRRTRWAGKGGPRPRPVGSTPRAAACRPASAGRQEWADELAA